MSAELTPIPDEEGDPDTLAGPIGNRAAWDRKPWRAKFLDVLSKTGNVSAACREARISRKTVYDDRDHDEPFKLAWGEAVQMGADALEQIAWRRATVGYQKTKRVSRLNDRGELVVLEESVEDHISDTLLIFLLNGIRPEKYRPGLRVTHEGDANRPIRIQAERVRSPERFTELLEIAAEMGWTPGDSSGDIVVSTNGHDASGELIIIDESDEPAD